MRESITVIENKEWIFKKNSNSLVYLEYKLFDLHDMTNLNVDTPANDFYNSLDKVSTKYFEQLIRYDGMKAVINHRWDRVRKVAIR